MATARQTLTDHDAIRQWAEARGAHPAHVKGTGGGDDVGMLRLDFPGYSGEESLQPIDWDEWFQKFDENKLALIVQETTSGGKTSNFNKLVQRKAESGAGASERGASRGTRQTGGARLTPTPQRQADGDPASTSRTPSRDAASDENRDEEPDDDEFEDDEDDEDEDEESETEDE